MINIFDIYGKIYFICKILYNILIKQVWKKEKREDRLILRG